MKTTFKFLLLTASFLFAHTGFAQIAIVAGIKSTATVITRDQASALFLGKSTQLPGAGIPVLIDQVESVDARQIFYTKVTEKTPAQVKAVWSRLVFSGKGSPPKEVANSAEVKKLVNANPDAVGYIEKSAVDSSVKVLLSID
jgi:ABC-type phosphate transport system substrate-binding protein